MKYQVLEITEEDYGCEGIPDGEELACNVLVKDNEGNQKRVKIPDKFLRENKINEGSFIDL